MKNTSSKIFSTLANRYLLLLFIFAFGGNVSAQVYWDGSTDSNWNTASNWVGGAVPNATWAAIDPTVQTYPNAPIISANSTFTPTFIDVLAGGTLTIQADLTTTDKITIDGSTSVLTMTAGTVNIAIAAAKNFDLKAQATFNFSGGTVTAGKDMIVNEGSIVMMSGTAALTVVNKLDIKNLTGATSSSFNMSAGTVTVTGNVQLDGKAATSTPTLNVSGGTFTVNGQTFWLGNNTDFPHLIVSGGTVTLVGDVSRKVGETSNIDIDVSLTGALIFQGNLTMDAAADRFDQSGTSTITFQNIKNWTNSGIYNAMATSTAIFDGSSTLLNSGTFNFYDLTINTAKTLIQSGPANINVARNWTNSGTFTPSTGTVSFNGTAAQQIIGTSTTTFNNLTIANTSATGVTLFSAPANVNGALTLTSGKVYTDLTNILTMNAGSTATAGSASTFVDGPMNKAGTTAFVFPLGDGNKWARLGIGAPTASTTFRAQYFATPYSNTTSMAAAPLPVLNNVSTKEYWTLDRTAGTGNATVTLHWEDAPWSGINDCSTTDLRIAHWDVVGVEWENNNDAVTTTGTCSGTSAGSVSTTAVVSAFGPFTFGSLSSGVNPLPIELLSFQAILSETKKVNIRWVTATETNNDYFTVEKSSDGFHFKILGKLKGAGSSLTTQNYSLIDDKPFNGISYYRLKQTDYDGKYKYSHLVAVTCSCGNVSNINIYPNPNNGYFVIEGVEENTNLTIFNVLREKIMDRKISSSDSEIKLMNLSDGIYFIYFSSETGSEIKKIIVNK